MRIRSKLDQILKEKRLTRAELQRKTGLHTRVIRRLYMDTWQQVSRAALEAVCRALEITSLSDLMELYEENVFYPIFTQKKLTIYLGAQAELEPEAPARPPKLGHGVWDTRAAFYISNYLRGKSRDLDVQFEIVISRPSAKIDYDFIQSLMQRIDSGGNHIIIGSPFSNVLAEYVLCRFYQVRPFTPEDQAKIPYRFVWPEGRRLESTLEKHLDKKKRPALEPGIYGERKGKVIAASRFATVGEGVDCGIVAVRRHRAERPANGQGEGVVMVLAGYSGTATFGAARHAVETPYEFFPGKLGEPLIRVISVKYSKLSKGHFDDRTVDGVTIVA